MSQPTNSLPTGEIQFFDNYVPQLPAEDYTITLTQNATSSDALHPLTEQFRAVQTFSVVAPRFALPPQDVQSVFPPPNASGIFDQNFAHVVLNERALPWERRIGPGVAGTTPWMALLLFTEDEIVPPANVTAPASLTNPTLAGSYPVQPAAGVDTLLKPLDPATLGPAVQPELYDETTCNAIDLTTAVFAQVAPLLSELPFLTHVREVGNSLPHKATDEASGDGWYSVVIGNRFPSAAQQGSPARYIAHLVSLEGFATYLDGTPQWPAGITKVRLASLQSWSFLCLPSVGSFARLALHLIASEITHLNLTSGGAGYTSAPQVTISGGGGQGASAAAVVEQGVVTTVAVVSGGSGYTSLPTVTFSGGGGSGAAATATLASQIDGPIASLPVTSGGSGYTSAPQVTISGGGGQGASATAQVDQGAVTALVVMEGGSGYTSPPTVTLSGGGGSGAAAIATLAAKGDTRLRLPVSAALHRPNTPGAWAQAALQAGYAPLAYDTRVGDGTFAWYRGPFVPFPIEPLNNIPPFESSAAASIYDSVTGTFDLSYAAAWEAGRLLALSASANATATMTLRKSLRRRINLLRERTKLGLSGDAAALEHPKGGSRSFVSWMTGDLNNRLPKPGVDAFVPAARTTAAVQVKSAARELGEMAEQAHVAEALTAHLQAALQEPQFSAALDWLAGLRLLEGVPFAQLAPNAAVLPAEAIRFFYVDPNYLNALADGAGSIGIQTTRDQAQHRALRAPLRQAAIARAQALRPRRIRRPHPAAAASPSDAVAGFLLRSALVSGWPGLEVKAYASTLPNSHPPSPDPASLIAPLRIDRLAPDVLLCLFPKVPVWIELNEPKEGLAFGVEDPAVQGGDPQVALRYLDNSAGQMGQTTGKDVTFTLANYLRDAATRVVNIDAWQQYLAGQVPPSTSAWGPAAFAIEMVRAPEQMIFQNQPNSTQERANG